MIQRCSDKPVKRFVTMYSNLIKIHINSSANNTNITSKLNHCSAYCVICPKTKTLTHISADVYIRPNRMVVAGYQHRISNPMFRILCAFHEYQGEVLSRAFLLSYGWGLSNLVKNNVTVAISEIRYLLSNKSDLRIVTIHGVGYRMISMNEGTYK